MAEDQPLGGALPTPPYPPVLPGQLDNIARSEIIVDGLTIGFRRALEFVAGSTGTVITAVDDSVNEKVTITITAQANTTGDIKESLQTADHDEWLILQGGSFDGGTWPNLQTLLGGTTLPDFRGRSPMGSGTGTGLTARTLKLTYGTETHTQTLAQIAQHSHTLSAHTHGMTHTHDLVNHTHSLSSHTHALESHTHGVHSGAHYYTDTSNGVFDLQLVAAGSGSPYSTSQTQTMTPAFFGGPQGPSTNTSGTPSSNTTGAATSSSTGVPSSDTTSTVPGSAATAMPIVHPVYVVNFFIYAA